MGFLAQVYFLIRVSIFLDTQVTFAVTLVFPHIGMSSLKIVFAGLSD